MQPKNEEELLQQMAEVIEKSAGIVLEPEAIKALLLEVQREQLKGLVYKAFMLVNQPPEAPEAEATREPTGYMAETE